MIKQNKRKRHSRERIARRLIADEQHTWATNVSSTVITTAGNVYDFGQVPQGNTTNARIGNRIWLEKIQVRLGTIVESSSNQTNFIRCVIFLDRRCNGSAPAVTDVLDSALYDAPLNHANRERFQCLYDSTWPLSYNGHEADYKVLNLSVNKLVDYTTGATTLAALNQPFILLISDSFVAAHPVFVMGSQMFFVA
jgi:hypothetical protein